MTSDGSTEPTKFSYTERDQLASIKPHSGSAIQIVSHGTGQEDLAAIGEEEVIQNVLGTASTGTGETAAYYTRGSEGQLLAKRTAKGKPSETSYYLQDTFGSVALLTNASGTQIAPSSGAYQYDPYGNPIGTAPSTFGYRSGQLTPDGLIHYGARYYDTTNGSWTQQDPLNQIEALTQSDRFAYTSDDPLNNVDFEGDKTFKEYACLAAALYAFCTNNGDEKFKAWPTRNQEQIEQVERENPDIFSDSEEDDSSLSLRDYLDTLRDDADGDE